MHQAKARFYVTEDKSQDFKKQKQDQGLCCNKGIHSFWNCAELKMIKVIQRYDVVKKQKLFFGCLGKAQCIKDGKVNPSGIDGCDRKHTDFYMKIDPKEDQYTENQPTLIVCHPIVACYR